MHWPRKRLSVWTMLAVLARLAISGEGGDNSDLPWSNLQERDEFHGLDRVAQEVHSPLCRAFSSVYKICQNSQHPTKRTRVRIVTAFRELKDAICTNSVLHCPDFGKLFTLQKEASRYTSGSDQLCFWVPAFGQKNNTSMNDHSSLQWSHQTKDVNICCWMVPGLAAI